MTLAPKPFELTFNNRKVGRFFTRAQAYAEARELVRLHRTNGISEIRYEVSGPGPASGPPDGSEPWQDEDDPHPDITGFEHALGPVQEEQSMPETVAVDGEEVPIEYSLHLDVPITRRQNVHQIFNAREELVYNARELSEAIDWLIDQEAPVFAMVTPSSIYLISALRHRDNQELA